MRMRQRATQWGAAGTTSRGRAERWWARPRLHAFGLALDHPDDGLPAIVGATTRGMHNAGFDVVSSQSGTNGVAARVQVNTAHGVNPP